MKTNAGRLNVVELQNLKIFSSTDVMVKFMIGNYIDRASKTVKKEAEIMKDLRAMLLGEVEENFDFFVVWFWWILFGRRKFTNHLIYST